MANDNQGYYNIFTFGCDHPYAGQFVKAYGQDNEECRQKMFKAHGKAWCFQYSSEEDANVEKHGYILHAEIY